MSGEMYSKLKYTYFQTVFSEILYTLLILMVMYCTYKCITADAIVV